MKNNIVYNLKLEDYKKKYRNSNFKLLKISKHQVNEFNNRYKTVGNDYLLKNRKWAFINGTYYEIPKKFTWVWFKNLKLSLQVGVCALLGGLLASSIAIPIIVIANQKFTYNLLEDGTYSIKARKAFNVETLEIPSNYKGKKVTLIENEGFNNCSIKTLKLPNTINKVGEKAFYSCGCSNIYVDNKAQTYSINFNDCPISFDNVDVYTDVKCFGEMNLPEIKTVDQKTGTTFNIILKDINKFGDTIKYNVGHNDLQNYRTTGEMNINSNIVSSSINAKVHGYLDNSKFEIYKSNKKICEFKGRKIAVSAPEYNFAILNASYPVLLFSLKAKTFTNSGKIPTYIGIERYKSYDWNNLTYNMKHIPNVGTDKSIEGSFHGDLRSAMREYIKELHLINAESKFNLFCVDNNSDFYFDFLVSNGIDDMHCKLILLTDGSLTSVVLNETFGIEKYQAKFDCNSRLDFMKNEIVNAKQYFKGKKYNIEELRSRLTFAKKGWYCPSVHYSIVLRMLYSNVEYYTGRLKATENLYKVNNNDSVFCNKIISCCTIEYTNNLLKNLTAQEQLEFKKMYKFSDDIFEKSRKEGKKIITIMGGDWNYVEKNNFYAYLKMTMEYYGTDEYNYYYKGHPGYPTDLYQERKNALNQLRTEGYNIDEIECSIAAEIILFYNPDIYASGWDTTTFESLEDNSKGVAIYDMRIEGAASKTYRDKFGCFFSVATNEDMIKYLGESKEKVYLIQYNGNPEASSVSQQNFEKHDVALFLLNENKIRYWKNNYKSTGNTVEVDKEGNPLI